ncbi:MAG TPA: PAS domain S-box protein, partial [Rhodocyclaceae bacterium]|nr:PAS domain S-box protein [Rhodocyclaceae bacterium]
MKRLSITSGLLVGYLLVAVLPLVGLGWLSVDAFESALTQTVEQNIAAVADRKTAQINDFVDEAIRDARILSVREEVCEAVLDLGAAFRRGGLGAADRAARRYRAELVAFLHESERFHDVLLIDAGGNVVFSIRRETDLGANLTQRDHRNSALGIAYQRAMESLSIEAGPFLPYAPSAYEVAGFIVAPIFEGGVPIGAVAVQTNFSALAEVFADRVDLKNSGRVVVGQRGGPLASGVSFYPPAATAGEVLSESLVAAAMDKAVRGEYGSGFLGPDPERRSVLAAWRFAPAIAAGLVVAIDADEVLVPVETTRRLIRASLGGILLLATLVAMLVGRRILRAESRLASREAQYRSIFQGIDDGVVVFRAADDAGRAFRIADLNPAAERMTGRSRQAVLGGDATGLFPAAERAGMLDPLRRVWRLERDQYLPLLHYEDDELSIWIECNFHRLRNGDVLAVIKNVSERKRAEDDVARSISLLNEAQRIANLGSWSFDLRSRKLEWSDQIYRIFGLDPRGFAASYEGFLQCVHPDDRATVDRAYADSLSRRQPYDISHRLLLADGRVRYVRERCETEFAADGTPLVSHGTVQDITDLREVEAEKALYARAFEHSGEAMVITDPQERILAVNRAFTRHTGYAAGEVLGQTPRLLAAGRTPRRVYEEMWQALLGGGFWQGEVWDRRKDGSVYPKWLNISAVRDVAGEISHYVGSFIDTSERKASEEKIQFLAHYDLLTGLFNRSSLDSRLDHAVLSARRDGARVAVMFIDLD